MLKDEASDDWTRPTSEAGSRLMPEKPSIEALLTSKMRILPRPPIMASSVARSVTMPFDHNRGAPVDHTASRIAAGRIRDTEPSFLTFALMTLRSMR